MAKIEQTPPHGRKPQRRGKQWKRLWKQIKKPLELLIWQLISLALQKWLR